MFCIVVVAITAPEATVWAAGIGALGGVLTALVLAIKDLVREGRTFQRDLINRLLDREEKILTPLVGHAENVQSSLHTIGDGVADLRVAQRIEDGSRNRRREGSD